MLLRSLSFAGLLLSLTLVCYSSEKKHSEQGGYSLKSTNCPTLPSLSAKQVPHTPKPDVTNLNTSKKRVRPHIENTDLEEYESNLKSPKSSPEKELEDWTWKELSDDINLDFLLDNSIPTGGLGDPLADLENGWNLFSDLLPEEVQIEDLPITLPGNKTPNLPEPNMKNQSPAHLPIDEFPSDWDTDIYTPEFLESMLSAVNNF